MKCKCVKGFKHEDENLKSNLMLFKEVLYCSKQGAQREVCVSENTDSRLLDGFGGRWRAFQESNRKIESGDSKRQHQGHQE